MTATGANKLVDDYFLMDQLFTLDIRAESVESLESILNAELKTDDQQFINNVQVIMSDPDIVSATHRLRDYMIQSRILRARDIGVIDEKQLADAGYKIKASLRSMSENQYGVVGKRNFIQGAIV